MEQSIFLHSPTLESVIMVERTIQKYSQECGKYQLWKKLPKKMMYQTFQVILNYLEDSGKIMMIGTPKELKKKTKSKSLEEAFLKLTGHHIREEEASAKDRMRMHGRLWRR